MRFYVSAIGPIDTGRPLRADAGKTFNHVGIPVWFTRGSLHRAVHVLSGPYHEPEGLFTVQPGEVLVYFEVKQPPKGSLQEQVVGLRPVTYAILSVDRNFIHSGSLLYKSVDPDSDFEKDDDIAVWFGMTFPATVVGRFRKPTDTYQPPKETRGHMLKDPNNYN